MTERNVDAALAGLLHNVGVLAQRAGSSATEVAETLRFIEDHVPAEYQAAARAGAQYGGAGQNTAGDTRLSAIVALADVLSLGQGVGETAGAAPGQLVTIFDRVSLLGRPRADNFLPLAPLALSREAIFPSSHALPPAEARQRYAALRAALAEAISRPIADGAAYVENLLGALKRFAWCVPTQGATDVSLYDHARMTAALAVCLGELGTDEARARLNAVRRDFAGRPEPGDDELLSRPAALLVGGDVSGVQDFIYTLSSKGAAKTLRGRSFYLQLLTEAVLRHVLRALDLPYTNVIYSGGGHFYLLAPPAAAARLPELRVYITRALLQHHGAALYLALDHAAAPAGAFKLGRFPEVWGQMHAALGRAKQRRYGELGDDLYAQVFEPQTHGGNREATCAVCGEEGRAMELLGEPDDPQAKICALCRSFQALGAQLPEARYVVIGQHAARPTERRGALDVLRAFGVSIQLVKDPSVSVGFDPQASPATAVILALDDADQWPSVASVPSARTVHYTVHRIPPKDFNALQEEAKGIERLGVLRMDVDQLGELFSRGFGEAGTSWATLTRLAALSFQLSLFFEGWVKHLCEQQVDHIYAVYAGGDDVFLIGPWDLMPALATSIANDLADFAGHNADVHVSGGLVFIHGKYPVYQAADDAGSALDAAKALPGKNALSFLGQAWRWPDFGRLVEQQSRLLKLVGGEAESGLDGPQAILQVLRQLAEDEADTAKRLAHRPVWGPWMWHSAYQLTRMACAHRKKPELERALLAIRDELSADEYREIRLWGAAARWAQLQLREKRVE